MAFAQLATRRGNNLLCESDILPLVVGGGDSFMQLLTSSRVAEDSAGAGGVCPQRRRGSVRNLLDVGAESEHEQASESNPRNSKRLEGAVEVW